MLNFHRECWNPVKKHSKASVFFAVSKQIPVVYSADRGRAENTGSDTSGHFTSVRFCLSHDHFKLDFIVFKVDIISIENATLSRLSLWCYMYAPKCYVTCGHTIFMTWHCPLNTTSATSYDKFDSDIVFCIRFWHCTLYEILVFKAHLFIIVLLNRSLKSLKTFFFFLVSKKQKCIFIQT